MVQAFVKVTDGGYVTEWSMSRQIGFQQIEADESLISNIDCVQVVDGVAILDEEKQAKIIQENQKPTDLVQIEQENADLALQLAELEADNGTLHEGMNENQQANADLMMSLAEAGVI